MTDKKALIADDDESIVWVLREFLRDKGFAVETASDGEAASALMKTPGVTIAFLDINMPGKDGLGILKEAREAGVEAPVIIMTAEATMKNALEALKLGAFDYVSKPFDLAEVELLAERAIENLRLRRQVSELTERIKEKLKDESVFIGKSKAVQTVFKTVGKVAGRDVAVLILGESGTGKELIARGIHANGPRSTGPFVAVNSAAVPRELMESELFGFERGAFTGATEAKPGKFELADNGTLFLDEVGDTSMELQSKLLRVIQEKEFYRLGGKTPIKVDTRIISATNQDMDKAVAEKRFREDLLYRLNGVTITMPPLRDRRGDVPILAEYLLEKFHGEFGGEKRRLSGKALEALDHYRWPGNVRELENVLRRAVLLSPGTVLSVEDLNLPAARHRSESIEDIITAKLRPFIEKTGGKGKQELYDLVMPFMERPLIRLVLEKTRGNQVQAAEVLGINRNTLRSMIKKLKIKIDDAKG
ncbi:MAG: sigma-54-dependent Fis family transcriptional regulator [Deltaproteobacteria bacterium]|nr:sigma-54-dependent Fis family transcriptional regulator [Deltaproteobacteria bacterium]